MFIVANPKPTTTYRNAIKYAASYRVKYETCKAKYAAKGKPVYPAPKGKCKAYHTKYEKYRLKASDAAKKALAEGGLTPELQAELSKAAKGVVDLAQAAGFIPASDAELQAAVAEEEGAEEPAEEEAPAADNTFLYAGIAGVALLAVGATAFFVIRSRRAK